MRKVARRFGKSLCTVQRWVERAEGQRLDRVDWADQARRPHRTTRTLKKLEDLILAIRRRLRDESILGQYGSDAILEELVALGGQSVPSRATIIRIVRRRGAVERHKRIRRQSPPAGWYLPAVARGEAELDSFDYIEGLKIERGPRFEVLTGVSLHGGLPAAFVAQRRTAKGACTALVRHWRRHGLPNYVQFDNDTIFQGAHQHPDSVGRVTRLCLSLGVTVIFAAPREHGPQNLVEGFNGRWQAKVWHRFVWDSLTDLRRGSDRYLTAVRRYRAPRIAAAPNRRPLPKKWKLDLDAPLRGTIIYLRRLDECGRAHLLGQVFAVDRKWSRKLVRAEVQLDRNRILFFGLSRRHPLRHARLRIARYRFPQKPFRR